MSRSVAWDLFVVRHTHPGNLAIHALSAALFFGGPVVALLWWTPWPLVGFALSGLLGASGHALFKDGGVSPREATSQPEVPPWVLLMFWMLLTGTWWPEVEQARERLRGEEGV